ncbi:hypothetical protein [Paraglaciecola sp. 2405UD69-4]|uniref:hypothetical protein n=1 Tax=Paraglaciecola sp. 2405UD69-4 TaxID=3391836 RepID=UPI0039C9B77B
MFAKSKIAAVAFISTLTAASAASAEDMSLESYVTSMVHQAMVVAQEEIKNSVHESVLNVAYNVSMDESKSYNGSVSISDIKVENEKASTTKTK